MQPKPKPQTHTSSNAMVCYDETTWNMLQVYCIHLPFFFFFFFFLCSVLLRVATRRFEFWLWSQCGESGEGWQQGRGHPHAKLTWGGEKQGGERRDERMNKTKSAADWGLPSRILKLHLLWRAVCVCVVCVHTYPLHASETFCVRAVRAHESNTISLQRVVPAAPEPQHRWTDEKWIKEQQKKGRKAE